MEAILMPRPGNVVPEMSTVTEDEFHGALAAGLGRAERKVGAKALAYIMDCTTKQLRNIFGGSVPHPKRLFDAHLAVPEAGMFDDIGELYGCKVVAKDAADNLSDLTLTLARALVMIREVQHPSSPGGEQVVHSEYLAGEELMREIHNASGAWLDRCSVIRDTRPGRVRVVGG
nr:hypothetical protein [Sphingomonas sp. Y57]